MPLFGSGGSLLEQEIEKATQETFVKGVGNNWRLRGSVSWKDLLCCNVCMTPMTTTNDKWGHLVDLGRKAGIERSADPSWNSFDSGLQLFSLNEDVTVMYDVCDRVNATPDGTKEACRCLIKRLQNPIPRVAFLALGLLDVCVMNCGKKFHLEICSREFTAQAKAILARGDPKVQDKLKFLLCKWANNEFKSDPQLAIINNFIQRSKKEGVNFDVQEPTLESMDSKPTQRVSNHAKQEEDDLAKAIELSLQESKKKEDAGGSRSGGGLYPSVSKVAELTATPVTSSVSASASAVAAPKAKESRKVRALYDFEAAEENELSFKAGEIIIVLEDHDKNWWKGSNHRGEGLFPSNFVTADLEAPADEASPAPTVVDAPAVASVTQVDEAKIDMLLHMLHDADPTVLERSDADAKMEALQAECALMTPLIDAELEKIDRKHQTLTTLSQRLNDALASYHQLLRQPQMPFLPPVMVMPSQMPTGLRQVPYYPPVPPMGVPPQGYPVVPLPPPGSVSQGMQMAPQQVVAGGAPGRPILHPGQLPPGVQMSPNAQVVMPPPYGYPHPSMNGTLNGALPPDAALNMSMSPGQMQSGQAQ
ncbi:signal transducing adapter molecule 2-like [Tropilaelaps mercedesae]|uniref:Signal transducing adapter molecule 2-like n=1 Tax=Tropilaelaps mercedesae TaxID=418985 RepID=A0A1V9X8Z4_9ACAR|nr:signal transducing adapter molecule 2-like [Tropilaelaps mercedesae]